MPVIINMLFSTYGSFLYIFARLLRIHFDTWYKHICLEVCDVSEASICVCVVFL